VVWVLGAAVAAAAIAAWLTVVLHLALVVRAELKLAKIVRQANAFAELPGVDSRELSSYAHRRLGAASLHSSRVILEADPASPGQVRVERIELPPGALMPRQLKPLGGWIGGRSIASKPAKNAGPFSRQP
jgi:hypothetical protein